mmetsp:Transcript_40684/g.94399  ORF Transcript_40684/g.94399 Transcript_40684/m.94399 type:complete len:271 (+) Transcript_40684:54-866(+)
MPPLFISLSAHAAAMTAAPGLNDAILPLLGSCLGGLCAYSSLGAMSRLEGGAGDAVLLAGRLAGLPPPPPEPPDAALDRLRFVLWGLWIHSSPLKDPLAPESSVRSRHGRPPPVKGRGARTQQFLVNVPRRRRVPPVTRPLDLDPHPLTLLPLPFQPPQLPLLPQLVVFSLLLGLLLAQHDALPRPSHHRRSDELVRPHDACAHAHLPCRDLFVTEWVSVTEKMMMALSVSAWIPSDTTVPILHLARVHTSASSSCPGGQCALTRWRGEA